MADNPIVRSVISTYCFFMPVDDLLVSEECQPDLPHFFDLYLKNYGGDRLVGDDGGAGWERQYHGLWMDSFVSTEEPLVSSFDPAVEFILVCPEPNVFSTGAHRAMMGYWYEGERYVFAVEEGAGFREEHVFISAFIDEGKSRIKDPSYVGEMLLSAVYAVSGIGLYSGIHDLNVIVSDDPARLLAEGCTPSPLMYRY